MAKGVEHLPAYHIETLSSNSSTTKKKKMVKIDILTPDPIQYNVNCWLILNRLCYIEVRSFYLFFLFFQDALTMLPRLALNLQHT
jgi:hypothetical protein